MFPASFEYVRAESVEEAVRLLGQHDDAKLLAGGHSLIPMMKLRLAQPETLVDIGRIADLRGVTADGGTVRVGALTTHGEIAASGVLHRHCPMLAEAAAKIADPAVRNRGTIGGNIAHADPASDLPAVLIACGASVHLTGPGGERTVAAGDFFVDLLTTDMQDGEILTAVTLPAQGAGTGACYLKVEHPASGYAICGAAAVVDPGGVRLVFNGVTATPLDATAVGEALAGGGLDDSTIAQAVTDHLRVEDPLGDVHASGEYRAELARVYGQRALATARDRSRA